MKRMIALSLALLMAFSLTPFAAFAEALPPIAENMGSAGDFEYSVSNGKATVTGYIGTGGDVVIPDTLGGYTVIAIGEDAFSQNQTVTTVSIPFGVTQIGARAFYNCQNLTSIVIPYGVPAINSQTFFSCKGLNTITIPSTVTSISSDAFTSISHLKKVYFGGTAEKWKAMSKSSSYLSIVSVEYIAENLLWGDANGDGAISNKDVVRLKNYLANYDEETGLSTVELSLISDANGDGGISNKDVVRLKNYLANFDETLGTSTVTLGPAS